MWRDQYWLNPYVYRYTARGHSRWAVGWLSIAFLGFIAPGYWVLVPSILAGRSLTLCGLNLFRWERRYAHTQAARLSSWFAAEIARSSLAPMVPSEATSSPSDASNPRTSSPES